MFFKKCLKFNRWNAYITGTKTTLESWPDYWTDPGFVNGLQG